MIERPEQHEPTLCRNCVIPTFHARTSKTASNMHVCVAHGRCECEAKDGHYREANGV